MAFTTQQRLMSLGVATPLAKELGRQIDAASYNVFRLIEMGMDPGLAKIVVTVPFNPVKAMQLGMTGPVATLIAEIAQYANARAALLTALTPLLSKLDAVYDLRWANDQQSSYLNLIGSQYTLTPTGSPTFVRGDGTQGNGTTNLLDTGLNPATAVGAKFTLNSAHMSLWSLTDGANVNYDMGNTNARMAVRSTSATLPRYTVNDIGFRNVSGVPSALGHFLMSRTGSIEGAFYFNGQQYATFTNASTSLTSANIQLLGAAGNFSARKIAYATIGAGLTPTEAATLYDALAAYEQAMSEQLSGFTFSKLAYADWAATLAATGSTIQNIGTSTGGSTVYGMSYGDTSKDTLMLVGVIHGAHEWRNAYILPRFMSYLNSPPRGFETPFRKIRDAFHVYCIPCANPYGYINNDYTNANDVNLNRNFDWNWAGSDGGSEGTKGSAPFSEVEAQIIRDKVLEFKPVGFLDFHIAGVVNGTVFDQQDGADEAFWATYRASFQSIVNPTGVVVNERAPTSQSHQWARSITADNGKSPLTLCFEPGELLGNTEQARVGLNMALQFGLALAEHIADGWPS